MQSGRVAISDGKAAAGRGGSPDKLVIECLH